YEEFEALLEACWGVAVEALPLSRLQRHLVDRLKGTDPELAAKAAALYGDQFQRLVEEIKQTLPTEGGAQGQGGADAPCERQSFPGPKKKANRVRPPSQARGRPGRPGQHVAAVGRAQSRSSSVICRLQAIRMYESRVSPSAAACRSSASTHPGGAWNST